MTIKYSNLEKSSRDPPQLKLIPFVDIKEFLSRDPTIVSNVARRVDEACRNYGLFMVVNHGIDPDLIREVHHGGDRFFGMSMSEKVRAKIEDNARFGYASSFTNKVVSSSHLRHFETLTFPSYSTNDNQSSDVESYFSRIVGEEFEHFSNAMEKYCEAMNALSLDIMELLSASLGIDKNYFREFFKESQSIFRLNYYPTSDNPDMVFGIAPHCDPSTITILHQEDVAGLQVLIDGEWITIPPNRNAFVINIGDTFMALSNGIYKSCIHSAILNSMVARQSITYFVNPKKDKMLIPPSDLMYIENKRLYPNYTWSNFLEFTRTNYVIDTKNLSSFSKWFREKSVTTAIEHEEK